MDKMHDLACYIPYIALAPFIGFLINGLLSLIRAKGEVPHHGNAHDHGHDDHHDAHGPVHFKASEIFSAIVACAGPLFAFALSVCAFIHLKNSEGHAVIATGPIFEWMATSAFKIDFGFMIDPLTSVMLLVITGVGSLIHLYSSGYMKGDPGFTRYFAYLNLFLFFMITLVLGDNLLILFVGWEGVGLASYLLIGFWFDDMAKAQAGKKAFITNRVGDFAFLIGLFTIAAVFSNQAEPASIFSYSFLKENLFAFSASAACIAALCFFIGATGKSAQIPLYVWLPDAMAGPTPVSALIHAATMVTAGVYLVARMFYLYEAAPMVLHLVSVIGLATALIAALMALTQYDIKKVLAYSTVSQLGFMFMALGVGAPQAAVFHVMTHAFFKACLFLCAGSIIYALHHEQDIRKMGGLFKKIPLVAIAFLVSNLAIAGIPPFAGFFSKDEILWNVFLATKPIFYVISVLVAGLTAFYMFRLFAYVFLGKARGVEPQKLPWMMQLPVAILAILAVCGGWVGIPHVLGGHNYFHTWLHDLSHITKTVEGAHKLEIALMALSTSWAILMSFLAASRYSQNLNWTAPIKTKLSGLHQLFSNKFYVDELYNAVLIKPLQKISDVFLWKVFDVKIIDGILVHGWGRVANLGARLVSWVQTGAVGTAILVIWVAVGFWMAFLLR